jgi:hypothetical protein
MSGGWRIPEGKRDLFKEPLGTFVTTEDLRKRNAKKTITVGDVVSLTMWKEGIIPDLAIYDGRTERRDMTEFAVLVEERGLEKAVVSNPAGTITRELEDAVRNALDFGPALIRVEGEEDLALMPCIRHAPEGTDIVYGWPGKGMMVLTTDAAVKDKTERLWKEMEELE